MITEIFIENRKLDLYEDIELSLNYQVSDIREIDSKQTGFSYEFIIPGTKTNNEIFGHIYEVQSDNLLYNPNFKKEVQVYVDGNQAFQGFLQLYKIIVNDEDNIDYEVILYGSLSSLYTDIAEDNISDIDLSKYNHVYSRPNIEESWDTQIKVFGANEPFRYGRGYVYPYIQKGISTTSIIDVESFYPAIYAKEILDTIFDEAGYSYKSKFLTSAYFKQLIIPFAKDKILLTDDEIKNRGFSAERTSTNSFLNRTPTIAGDFFSTPLFNTKIDPGNRFSDSFLFTANKKGRYKLSYGLFLSSYYEADTVPFYIVGDNITYTIQLIKNGAVIYSLPGFFTHTSGANVAPVEFSDFQSFEYNVTANPGDTFYMRIRYTIPPSSFPSKIVNVLGQAINGNIQFRMKPTSTAKAEAYNDGIVEGDMVFMNQILPENIKKKDFITSIFKLFNLMVYDEKSDSRILLIEPRDDFYAQSKTIRDWSLKIDKESVEYTPLAELTNKTFSYTYKEDFDFFNELYLENTGEIYGEYKYVVDNDFVEGDLDIGLIFSPTPNATDEALNLSAPHFLTYDNDGTPAPKKTNIRLLFYSGLKPGDISIRASLSSPNIKTYTSYPYCGMENDPYNPTESLVFGVPKEAYYGGQSTWTNSNVFNRFHENTLSEITDKNSKLLTAYFDLSPVDISEFQFNDRVFIDNVYWRVNKIENYSPAENQLTKVELFSPIEPLLFVPSNKPVSSGPSTGGTVVSGVESTGIIPVVGPVLNEVTRGGTVNGNTTSSPTSSTNGEFNLVGADSFADVIGSNNSLGDAVANALVVGDSNLVASNVQNVVVLGSTDKIITSSDVIVLGDSFIIKESSGLLPIIDIIDGGLDTVQNPFNKVVAIDILDAGNDAVRELGTDSIVMIVDSGQDIVQPNNQI